MPGQTDRMARRAVVAPPRIPSCQSTKLRRMKRFLTHHLTLIILTTIFLDSRQFHFASTWTDLLSQLRKWVARKKGEQHCKVSSICSLSWVPNHFQMWQPFGEPRDHTASSKCAFTTWWISGTPRQCLTADQTKRLSLPEEVRNCGKSCIFTNFGPTWPSQLRQLQIQCATSRQ